MTICAEKFLYFWENYDMCGKIMVPEKIFVFWEKLRYVWKIFCIFGKITIRPKKISISGKIFATSTLLPRPPLHSSTFLGKEILISDSAKFVFITQQNSLTPPTQRGLATPMFQWSGPDHWNVINISHLPNFLELNL
jgi:hypothetical protein